jgi:hypothetical protein
LRLLLPSQPPFVGPRSKTGCDKKTDGVFAVNAGDKQLTVAQQCARGARIATQRIFPRASHRPPALGPERSRGGTGPSVNPEIYRTNPHHGAVRARQWHGRRGRYLLVCTDDTNKSARYLQGDRRMCVMAAFPLAVLAIGLFIFAAEAAFVCPTSIAPRLGTSAHSSHYIPRKRNFSLPQSSGPSSLSGEPSLARLNQARATVDPHPGQIK